VSSDARCFKWNFAIDGVASHICDRARAMMQLAPDATPIFLLTIEWFVNEAQSATVVYSE
jgi:hypothetical protein